MGKHFAWATLVVAMAAGSVSADPQLQGKIKICRQFHGTTDHQAVTLPANADYTAACNPVKEHCRNIVITVTSSAVLGAAQSCLILPAILSQSDGKPVKAGETLVTQWSITGFEPSVTVTETFH